MTLHVVCAWCGIVVTDGYTTRPSSHGLCLKRRAILERKIDADPTVHRDVCNDFKKGVV